MKYGLKTSRDLLPDRPRRVLVAGVFVAMLGMLSGLCAMSLTTAVLLEEEISELEWWWAVVIWTILLTWLAISACTIWSGYAALCGRKYGQQQSGLLLGGGIILFTISAISNIVIQTLFGKEETQGFFSWSIWILDCPIILLLAGMLGLLFSPKANAYFRACERLPALQTP